MSFYAGYKTGSWTSIPVEEGLKAYGKKYNEVTNPRHMKYYNRRKRAYRKRGGKPTPIRYSWSINPRPKNTFRYSGRKLGRRRLTTPMDASPPRISQSPGFTRARSPSTPRAKKKLRFSNTEPNMSIGIVERKTHYLSAENLTLNVGEFETNQLYYLPQGVKMGDRIGTSIRAHSILINGSLRNLVTSLATTIRVVLVHDKRPQLGDLKQNFFRPKTTDNAPHNFVNSGDFSQVIEPINNLRFRVLSDRRFSLAPSVSGNQGKDVALINYRVKVNRRIQYLSESTLNDSEKVIPNMYLIYFVENESSTTGTGTAEVKLNLYEEFSG